jgi:predicted GTPase
MTETNEYAFDSGSNEVHSQPAPPHRQTTLWELSANHHTNFQEISRRISEQLPSKSTAPLFPYQPMNGLEPIETSQDINTVQQQFIVEPDEDPMQHLVLLPLGKTGSGKSSLLNILLGYEEFKAKAAAKVSLIPASVKFTNTEKKSQ